MQQDDFWVERGKDLGGSPKLVLDVPKINRLASGAIAGDDDLASASALARIVHSEFVGYGTDGSQTVTDQQSAALLRALRAVLARQDLSFSPPWRDFTTFRSYWLSHDGYNSWGARRAMLAEQFDPIFQALGRAEDAAFDVDLAEPVSPRMTTGWKRVDDELNAMRQRFRTASTMQDYRDVGNRCVGIMEALSETVYVPERHDAPGKPTPGVAMTDVRIGAYIDERLPGSGNEELRALVKKTSAFAHRTKHSPKSDRTSAGIAADAVIMLANLLRRLAE